MLSPKLDFLNSDTTDRIVCNSASNLTERGSFLMAKLWVESQSGSNLLQKNHQLCKIPCASRLRSCIGPTPLLFSSHFQLMMPLSIAIQERSFSCMRRVKTYLQSTMQAETFREIALVFAYRDTSIDEHRHRQGRPGVLRQETPQTGIWNLNTCTQIWECHCNTAFSLRKWYYIVSKEIQHERELIAN